MNLMKYVFVAVILCLYTTMVSAFEPIPGESGSGGFLFSGFATETRIDSYGMPGKQDESARTADGVRIVWDKILTLDFQSQYTGRDIGIDKRSWMPLGLTREQMRLPGRESDLQQTEFLHSFPLADSQILIPSFIYTRDDLDGGAMSFDTYGFKLTYFYTRNKFNLIANGFIGRSEYEKRNSTYDKKQEDDRYGGAVTVSYRQPFGWQPFGNETFNLWGNVAFYRSEANIDFNEQEEIEAAMGAMIRF
jgi:hypothetical protein